MLFNSLEFFLFLPVVLGLYFLLPTRFRWVLLLISGYYFYAAWKIEYVALIIFSTILDFVIARFIYSSKSDQKKKILLILSLVSNFSLLILFKYFHFLIGGSTWFKNLAESNESVLWLQFVFEYGIPVGISFYTFQTVSYTIDVYKGKIEPEKNLGKFALFVSFFPQLVAGPIERFSQLHPQLFKPFQLQRQDIRKAFQLMLFGFFLKMCIADSLGTIISPVFSSPENYLFQSKFLAAVFFSIQIYADFNGYTLIAIGTATLFGVRLMDNFKSPYGSYSIREFWSRWHISLSTWFRDYVYIPLGGNQSNKRKWILAIIMTFGLSGLWHGANVTFIYWGLIHGVYYLIENLFFPVKNKLTSGVEKAIRWFLTMTVVLIGWIFFRADSMKIVGKFFSFSGEINTELGLKNIHFVLLTVFLFTEILFRFSRVDDVLNSKSFIFRWSIYMMLIFMLALGSDSGDMQFIYFQF